MERVLFCLSLSLLVGSVISLGPCDPLVPEYCQLPFPNSFFTAPDPSTGTGVRVNFTTASFPKTIFGQGADVKEWNTLDGFSPFPSILAFFPDLTDSGLPFHWSMKSSMGKDCPTVVLDAHTGERIVHFAELDTAEGLAKRALMLWPSQRLKTSWRYIVALRNLRDSHGDLIKPSKAFLALRDNISSSDPDVESRRGHFEDIFSRLQAAGIARGSLQLAWDFTTASLSCLTKRLLFARDDAFARVGEKGASFSILEVKDNYSDNIFRRITGTMRVPLYTDTALPGAHLVVDSNGLPVYQGMADATFTVLVPHSIANGSVQPAAASVLQYGHGLFGSQSEVESGYLQVQANRYGYVMAACNWWGMDEDDVPAIVALLIDNIGNIRVIPDRLTQGMVNALLLMRTLKGGLASDPILMFGGKSVINPKLTHYYGNSLGGIMGVVYMAATTDVIRGVLGVTGGPFGLLLPRSVDFDPFAAMFRALYPDPVDYISGMAVINMLWSRLEPNAYMSSITSNPLPGTPTHRVLFHYALGDAQVNILGLYSVTRSAGAVMFESAVRETFALATGKTVLEELYGFPLLPDNTTVTQDSAAVGFDCGAPPEPAGNTPPNSATDTHEGPRHSVVAQAMMDLFLKTGEIRNVCGGTCKCTL